MKPWQSIFLGIIIGLVLSGIILMVSQTPRGHPLVLQTRVAQNSLTIYVAGAVRSPGLVTISRSSRIADAIIAAGGFTETANQEAINLAGFLSDGDKIIVPPITSNPGSVISPAGSLPQKQTILSTPIPTISFPININLATAADLESLPGIGPTKAQDIILYRQEHGFFIKVEDLTNVSGIGKITLDRIRDLISIGK